MADARLVRGSQRRAVAIVEIAALDQDRQALTRLLPQRIGRALHKVGVDDSLIVIQKDNRIVSQHGGAGKAHVANGAVTAQAHALTRALGRDLRHTIGDTRCLSIGDNSDLERRMRVDDIVHAQRHIGRGRNGTDHQKDDARDVAHLLERCQAAVEFGIGGVESRRMIVGARGVCASVVARPIRWNHDRGVHALPSLQHKNGAPPNTGDAPRPS